MRSVFAKLGVAAVTAGIAVDGSGASAAVTQPAASLQPYSNFLPPLESIALPEERGVLDTFMAKTRPPGTKPAIVLAAADEALAKLGSPTKLRGFIQYARAISLAAMHHDLDAIDAAQESAQLLPGYSAPLIVAFTANAYLSRTGPATEYLMRAIDVDPTTARTIDDYEINNLLGRLRGFNDDNRVRAISSRLLQIGWIGNHLDSRSSLAVQAIESRVDEGDLAGAKSLVPKLLDPGDSRSLLMLNAYSSIWPEIEAWAGPRLERQWPLYLEEARSRWMAGRTSIAARDYLSALRAAGLYETAVDELLPLLERPRTDDTEAIFMVAPLANTLARLGRWKDAEVLFQHAQETWPLGTQANALNISANHSVLLLKEGRAGEGLERIDATLADARRWGPEVGATGLAGMQHNRACLLHELGRDGDAAVSVSEALTVERGSAAALLHLCMGDPDAAKKALLDALNNEATRDDVIRFVQPPDDEPLPSDYARRERAAVDALRTDPDILRAVEKFGRILPWRLNEAAGGNGPVIVAH